MPAHEVASYGLDAHVACSTVSLTYKEKKMRKLDVLKLELLQEKMKELDEQRSEIVEEILRLEQELIRALEKSPKTLNGR